MTASRATTRPRDGGFTLINVMVSVGVLAVLAGAMVSTLTPDDRARALGAARLVASDLEFAQSLSLSQPHDPAVVVFDAVNDGYWVARDSDPETPVERPDGSPYVVIFGEGNATAFEGVDIRAGAGGGVVTFDAFGRLDATADAGLLVGLAEEYSLVTVSSSTGFTTIARTDPPTGPEAPPDASGGAQAGAPLGGGKGR